MPKKTTTLSHPDLKPKRTIQAAIQGFVDLSQPMTATSIAKAVGVSRHRVLKYCKSRGIELDKLNEQITQGKTAIDLQTTTPPEPKPAKKKKPMVKLGDVHSVKVSLGAPQAVKINLDQS